MLIITLRTDKPEAEIGIFEDHEQLAYRTWLAHRELAETLELTISNVLDEISKSRTNLQGIVVYEGPGSFTGLRIGASVANAMAYSLNIPIVDSGDNDWIKTGITRLSAGENQRVIVPVYGALPNITLPSK